MGPAAWMARIVGFLVLAVDVVWAVVVFAAALLSIMWGPPCMANGVACGPGYWTGVGIALLGTGVVFVLVVIALPVAWRRPVALAICDGVALVVLVASALWGLAVTTG